MFLAVPWKRPARPLWRVYLGYMCVLVGAALVIYFLWQPREMVEEVPPYYLLFAIVPLSPPLFVFGGKSWEDLQSQGETPQREERPKPEDA